MELGHHLFNQGTEGLLNVACSSGGLGRICIIMVKCVSIYIHRNST